MAKKTKTWKIGEYCKGGIITVEITGQVIVIIGKDWDMSQGTRRSSNQSNAKEFTRGSTMANEPKARMHIFNFLTDLTTPYYADKIIEWIESKVELSKGYGW